MYRRRLPLFESLLTLHGLAPVLAIALALAAAGFGAARLAIDFQREHPHRQNRTRMTELLATTFDFSVPGRAWWVIGAGAGCFAAAVAISRFFPPEPNRDAQVFDWSNLDDDDLVD